MSLVVLAWGAGARAQDHTAFAQQRFSRGTGLYDGHDYGHALDEFRASLALYASPNTRLYLARCLRELGRLDEALPEFERTVREADDRAQTDPRYTATRDAAQAELLALTPRVGRLTVTVADVPPTAQVRVAGHDVPLAGLGVAIPVMPGQVPVWIDAQGYVPDHRQVPVEAGHETAVEVHLQRVPVLEGNGESPFRRVGDPIGSPIASSQGGAGVPRAAAWSAWGVGAAGFAGFAVFGLMAGARYDNLQTTCMATTCPDAQRAAVSGGRTLQTLTNVSLGVGITGAAVGTVLWLLGHPHPTEAPAAVRLGATGTAVTLDGVF